VSTAKWRFSRRKQQDINNLSTSKKDKKLNASHYSHSSKAMQGNFEHKNKASLSRACQGTSQSGMRECNGGRDKLKNP